MSSITVQQAKLDLELVPKEKIIEIRKCNGILNPKKIQREPIFQVVLDALSLTLCYSAFLITADVLEICPRVQGQDYDALLTKEEIVSFLRDLSHTGEIHSLNDVVVDLMHQSWITFAAIINRSLCGKTSGLDKLRLSRVQILWVTLPNPYSAATLFGGVTDWYQEPRTLAATRNQRTRTSYECGSMRHYKSECPIVKFPNHVDMIHGRVMASKPKTMQDATEFTTELMDKNISTLAKRQAENKRKLDDTSKNN
ncbi:hypothetical protein Tco_0099539 [Tanacetum coccineum]